jgi:hypothetical protein
VPPLGTLTSAGIVSPGLPRSNKGTGASALGNAVQQYFTCAVMARGLEREHKYIESLAYTDADKEDMKHATACTW